MTAGLFSEPFDREEIGPLIACIGPESEKFMKVAIIMCGMQDRWEAALDQVGRMVLQWEEAGEDDHDLYRLLACLGLRAGQLRDPVASRAQFSARHPHLELSRINIMAQEIIKRRPRWYPLTFPLTREQAEHSRKFWTSL